MRDILDSLVSDALFRTLATLRTDIPLFNNVDDLKWTGPTPAFEKLAKAWDRSLR